MDSGKIHSAEEDFLKFYHWKQNNKYFGKQFSVFGDSISTLDGYNPKGYNLFYTGDVCDQSGIHAIQDTWWGKVIDYFGGKLLVNNSWSGSRVTKLPDQDMLFPSGCSEERTGGLHRGEVMPDVILIYLGTNDWLFGVQADADGKKYSQADVSIFSAAYARMLNKIRRNYPNAEVYCSTLSETYMSSNPAFSFPHLYAGTHIERFNAVIRQEVASSGCKLVELYNSHIPYDTIDGTHPTAAGMHTLAALILREMCDREGAAFLELPRNA